LDYFFYMISTIQKASRYERILIQARELLEKSPTLTSQFATINALVYHKVPYTFWAGFYLVSDWQLVVCSYQGPLACQILPYPKGICWQSVMERRSIIVPDISLAKNHIACDSRSKSEIVIPLFNPQGSVYGVFDVDSDKTNMFDSTDEEGLSQLLNVIDFKKC
jgi:L-methionine (R)-S-oxide reductase